MSITICQLLCQLLYVNYYMSITLCQLLYVSCHRSITIWQSLYINYFILYIRLYIMTIVESLQYLYNGLAIRYSPYCRPFVFFCEFSNFGLLHQHGNKTSLLQQSRLKKCQVLARISLLARIDEIM